LTSSFLWIKVEVRECGLHYRAMRSGQVREGSLEGPEGGVKMEKARCCPLSRSASSFTFPFMLNISKRTALENPNIDRLLVLVKLHLQKKTMNEMTM